jgi:hypothetical protein
VEMRTLRRASHDREDPTRARLPKLDIGAGAGVPTMAPSSSFGIVRRTVSDMRGERRSTAGGRDH